MREASATEQRSVFEMLEEVIDLSAGLGILLLPLLVTAIPGVILFIVLPALLIVALVTGPIVAAAALIGPPYLIARAIGRRRAAR